MRLPLGAMRRLPSVALNMVSPEMVGGCPVVHEMPTKKDAPFWEIGQMGVSQKGAYRDTGIGIPLLRTSMSKLRE